MSTVFQQKMATARKWAARYGHELSRFDHRSMKSAALAKCKKCGAGIYVTKDHRPDKAETGGLAIRNHCGVKT